MPTDLTRVREYRRSHQLAQRELAVLIGLATQHACSELESGAKRPGLEVAFACALALGMPLDDLFPGLASHIERDMLRRARALYKALRSDAERVQAASYVAALIQKLANQLS